MQEDLRKTFLDVNGLLVIVGGGVVDLALLKQLHEQGATVIGADGGANVFAELGIVPAAIIGDMDSLKNRADWETKTQVLEIFEQETTDFEKCLYSVMAPQTICLGMSGKRLDHTLAALDIMLAYSDARELVMVSETDLILVANGYFAFEVEQGARVSVHTIWPVLFAASKGLEYPLDGLELAPGKRLGTSNRAVGGVFEVLPEGGQIAPYLVIVEKKYLGAWLGEVEG